MANHKQDDNDLPPPYEPVEDIETTIRELIAIAHTFVQQGRKKGVITKEEIEDARRTLAISFPQTDLPISTRIINANTWITEFNKWLVIAKRNLGCATHEMVVPNLIKFERPTDSADVLETFIDNITLSVEANTGTQTEKQTKKQTDLASHTAYIERSVQAAVAIKRAAQIITKKTPTLAAEIKRTGRGNSTDEGHHAMIVSAVSHHMEILYRSALLPAMLYGNGGAPEKQCRAAALAIYKSVTVIASATVYVLSYQLSLATCKARPEADIAIQRAVSALSVFLTALHISSEVPHSPRTPRSWWEGFILKVLGQERQDRSLASRSH